MRVLSEAFLCQKENHQSRHSLTARRHSKFSDPEGYDSLTREKALEDETAQLDQFQRAETTVAMAETESLLLGF